MEEPYAMKSLVHEIHTIRLHNPSTESRTPRVGQLPLGSLTQPWTDKTHQVGPHVLKYGRGVLVQRPGIISKAPPSPLKLPWMGLDPPTFCWKFQRGMLCL